MGLEIAKEGKYLYHLTKLSNLDSILQYGLLSRRQILGRRIGFDDVADQKIIDKRTKLGLDEFTPFHFHPYSAFDAAVKHTYDAQEMIYICIERELAKNNNFLILPKHPLSEKECEMYEYEEGIQRIDWETLMEVGRKDNYAREVKMAECFTNSVVPPEWIKCFYVPSEKVKKLVEDKMKENEINYPPPYVNVQPMWFQN